MVCESIMALLIERKVSVRMHTDGKEQVRFDGNEILLLERTECEQLRIEIR